MQTAAGQSQELRVGVVGVGNCASSFVQGLAHYRDCRDNAPLPGLLRPEVGGYHVRDVGISAAFDVSAAKVGRDLSEAILAHPNNTFRFATVPHLGVPVHRGPTLDGLGHYLQGDVAESAWLR